MKKFIVSLFSIVIFFSCNTKDQVKISGEIVDGIKETVYLELLNVSSSIVIDSVKTNHNGKFLFKVRVTEPTFYAIKTGKEYIPLLLEPQQQIHINGQFKNLSSNYTVEGSEGSAFMKELNNHRNKTAHTMDSLRKVYDKIPEGKKYDNDRRRLSEEWDAVLNKQIDYSKEFIITHVTKPVTYYALYQKINSDLFILDPIREQYSYRAVATSMKAHYPESQYTKALLTHIKNIMSDIRSLKIRNLIDASENDLPHIELPDVKGKNISLNSLKGKFILLDFTVLGTQGGSDYIKGLRNTYKKFRPKGLEIYQVCLDQNKLLWEELVKSYRIEWPCVWDKDGLESKAALIWNIQDLPANYIINRDYEIVGKNLNGQRLEERLNDLLK